VSHTLGGIIFYLTEDEAKQKPLRNELRVLFGEDPETSPAWRDLEKAPYLTAVIQEGLRCVSNVNHSPKTLLVPDNPYATRI